MAGGPWCGFSTRKLRVLYVGAEGFFGLLRREAAWSKRATEDMSKVFDLIDMFRRELKEPTFIVVHHGTKDGLTYRGSSVIAANVDGAIEVSKDGLTLKLSCPLGMKDAAEFDTFKVRLEQMPVETEDGAESVPVVKNRLHWLD